ncbi:shikimate dehydrogenase [Salinisphaera aquimarina]|uniref:Shikimate dehydrogenase (NADP(+)) n=1 Tax=Salinisphaera aquimarina TaxID=2094031 RepID=A0ABV7EL19_9GAMM
MSDQPDRYAVIGNPVAHSRSPEIHAAFAAQTGQSLVYARLPAEIDAFEATVARFFADGGLGLNVTLPFKQQASEYADTLTDRARHAGAVNTLARQGDGRILGDNTDGAGLLHDLNDRLLVDIRDARILILGAGGAVRGVIPVLLDRQPAALRVLNRTPDKATQLATHFADLGPVSGGGLDEASGGWDIVINAISAGLAGEMPPLADTLVADAIAAYDMIYADAPTPFMRWARAAGVTRCSDGLGMLVEQAAESFAVWRGIRPATEPVIRALRPATQ